MPPMPQYMPYIATQIIVIETFKWKKDLVLRSLVYDLFQQTITCSKLASEAQE